MNDSTFDKDGITGPRHPDLHETVKKLDIIFEYWTSGNKAILKRGT